MITGSVQIRMVNGKIILILIGTLGDVHNQKSSLLRGKCLSYENEQKTVVQVHSV